MFTSGSSKAKQKRLVYGMPVSVSPDKFQFFGIKVVDYPNFSTTPVAFRIYNAVDTNYGGVYCNDSIEAGQYHIYGSYITT